METEPLSLPHLLSCWRRRTRETRLFLRAGFPTAELSIRRASRKPRHRALDDTRAPGKGWRNALVSTAPGSPRQRGHRSARPDSVAAKQRKNKDRRPTANFQIWWRRTPRDRMRILLPNDSRELRKKSGFLLAAEKIRAAIIWSGDVRRRGGQPRAGRFPCADLIARPAKQSGVAFLNRMRFP